MIRLNPPRPVALALLVTAFVALPVSLDAQVPVDLDPGSSIRTRADLEGLLQSYERLLQSPAYSNAVKNDVRVRADRIRDRLANGDFRLGDGVVLFVQGETTLPDTVAVQSGADGPRISLPQFGDIALAGVLRSEVQQHITEALSMFIRDPVVRAEPLMRISVQGAVGAPGFFLVPADMLLSQTLMVAGGPAQNSNLGDMRIERGRDVILRGTPLQEELRQGRTLDQLNLEAGDQIVVPSQGGGFFSNFGLVFGLVSSIAVLIVQIAR